MTNLKMTTESFKELVQKFKADAEANADISEYYRGKADAYDVILFAIED